MLKVWQGAYNRWYDHNKANHALRAIAWGWVADRLCQVGDVVGWKAE